MLNFYAGFWIRFVAVVIDGLIIHAGMTLIGILFGISGGEAWQISQGTVIGTGEPIFNGLTYILPFLYYIILPTTVWRGTIGKKVLGIEIVDQEGKTISIGRSIGRYFASMLSALILMVGYLMAAFHPEKRALHDILAGTYVQYK